jgi:hypothetical protein
MSSSSRTDKISISAIGATMRHDKIETARSTVIAIREQRRQQQEAIRKQRQQKQETPSSSTAIQAALLERLEGQLLANEMELTELRKLVHAWKGGVPVSQLLSSLGCKPEKTSCLGRDNSMLQKLEAIVLMKEVECNKARQLVAEARNKRDLMQLKATPSVLQTQPSSKSKKKSVTATCA